MDKKSRQKIRDLFQRAHAKNFDCFMPGCSKNAISSHSQSKENCLRVISEGGHLIRPSRNIFRKREDVEAQFDSIGIGKASTFRGFCSDHDSEFFRKVDSLDYTSLNNDSLMRLSFRTLANEVRAKERSAYVLNGYLEILGYREDINIRLEGVKNNLAVTTPFYKRKFTNWLQGLEYEKIVSTVYKVISKLPISASSILGIDLVDSTSVLNWALKNPLPQAFFNVVPHARGGLIIASSFPNERIMTDEMLNRNTIEDLIFNHCEDLFITPSFFTTLSREIKQNILAAQLPWEAWQPISFQDILNIQIESKITI